MYGDWFLMYGVGFLMYGDWFLMYVFTHRPKALIGRDAA